MAELKRAVEFSHGAALGGLEITKFGVERISPADPLAPLVNLLRAQLELVRDDTEAALLRISGQRTLTSTGAVGAVKL